MYLFEGWTEPDYQNEIARLHQFARSAAERIAGASEVLGHLASRRGNSPSSGISGPKGTLLQGVLWDPILSGHGGVRNGIGELAEILTASLVGGKRHKTDCTSWYCPDVSAKAQLGTVYYESKAVGKSNSVFVYKGRLEKDAEFVAAPNELYYAIWSHGFDTRKTTTASSLMRGLLDRIRAVYIVPFADVHRIMTATEPVRLNSRYGGSAFRREYGRGYRVSLSKFSEYRLWEVPSLASVGGPTGSRTAGKSRSGPSTP